MYHKEKILLSSYKFFGKKLFIVGSINFSTGEKLSVRITGASSLKDSAEIIFSAKMYSKDDFEFLGANLRYGFGGGLKLAFNSRQVMLIDSSVVSNLQDVSFYPSLSSFVGIYIDRSKSSSIKFIFDADVTYPATLQMSIMFSSDLEYIIKYAEENN